MTRIESSLSTNRRNYFRNHFEVRFRFRQMNKEEFQQWLQEFDASGRLPAPIDTSGQSEVSLDDLGEKLRHLAGQNNRIHSLVNLLLINLDQQDQQQKSVWNCSYLDHPSPMNISGGGIAFPLSHQKLAMGSYLELEIHPENSPILRTVARIVRIESSHHVHWYGCRFEMITARDRERIISLQMVVQREQLKKKLEDKIQKQQVPILPPEDAELPPPELVSTPHGDILNRRKLVRVEDSLPLVLHKLSKDEAKSSIAIFKKYGIFPNYWQASIFDEKKMVSFEKGLLHLKQYSPSLRDVVLEFWEELDYLFSQVSPAKKQNVFSPVIQQLIVTVHRLSGLSRISSMNTDIIKNLLRCLKMIFCREAVTNFRQVQKGLRLEFGEVLKKLKVLYRVDPMQKDIIYPVLEKLIQLAETVSQYGIRTI
ncbi:MAG: PilZ domain-containing protein, partial [Magnetococcales bacterium]|nr:PilZ domain-containing protein [Magnetococcales bacterium]